MDKIKEVLNLENNQLNIRYFIVLMFVAFAFSMSVRYIWVNHFSVEEAFMWNNELMINTNDGYFFAEGARDILQNKNEPNDLSPIDTPLAKLTATVAKMLPFFSFETIILWMPAVFGSLLIVPIMLVAREVKQDILGFCAALLGAIAVSYYNRTMVGYYDTDMFVVLFPALMIWGAIYALNRESPDAFVFAPLFAIAAMYWHGGMINIVNMLFALMLVYTIVFERKNLHYYKFLSIFIITLTTLSIWIKFLIIIGLIALFHTLKERLKGRVLIAIFALSVVVYLYFGGFNWVVGVLNNAYFTRLLVANELDLNSLKFFGVINTIRETGHIPFEIFADRISGSMIAFWISVVGYILLSLRYKILILTLPMIVLGFFAMRGGLRFTVFAVPFMSLGFFYALFFVAKYVEFAFADKIKPFAKYIFIAAGTIAVLYPNIKHIQGYMVPTVFQKDEVKVLDVLHKIASREDYVIAWWDYGYPIRYYSDTKTIVDGGKHDGKQNFPVAFALMQPQSASANMARLDVEFTEMNFAKPCGASIECMLKAYDVKDTKEFLNALHQKDMQKPQKTRDIFFYLPNRMMDIVSTIDKFNNINIMTGEEGASPFFYVSKNHKENEKQINLGNGIFINKEGATLSVGNQTVPLKEIYITEYNDKGILHKNLQKANPEANVSVIYMKNYNQFLVLDERMLNSTYIQLFVLENNDNELFEPVILSPLAKVYKLKI